MTPRRGQITPSGGPFARVARALAVVVALSLSVAGSATVALADEPVDTVYLMDGGRLRGRVLVESKTNGVRIKLLDGTTREVPPESVKLVEYGAAAPQVPAPAGPAPAAPGAPPEIAPARGALGAIGGFFGGVAGGVYIPTDEEDLLDDPGAVIVASLGGAMGYFVSPRFVVGGAISIAPGIGIAGDNVEFFIHGYAAFDLQFHLRRGGHGPFLEWVAGFAGSGSPDKIGGYGPMLGFGVKHVGTTANPQASLHPTIGGQLSLVMVTREGDVVGATLLGSFEAGFFGF